MPPTNNHTGKKTVARDVRQRASASPNGAKPRALISVSDKTGMTELAEGLAELGYEVISTGGSAKVRFCLLSCVGLVRCRRPRR